MIPMDDNTLAIRAHKQSIACAQAGDKAGWLALFAEDAAVFDPVGPATHDPEGKGFIGKARIADFWDIMIGPADLTLVSHKRIACGDHVCACNITSTNQVGGMKTYVEMFVIYEVDPLGKLTSLKAYWDADKVMEQVAAQSA